MYEKFYGLRNKPFSLLPDPEFLFPSKKHQMALTLLEYGLMNQASFSVITGDIGTGKTTLIRQLLSQMESDMVVGLITNTHPSFGELLQWILMAFNLECGSRDKVEMYKIFMDFLIKQYAANRRAVLIIDEAQNMGPQALEELRMLSNVNSEKDQVLQIILAGQPGLRNNLRDPRLEQFAQRISVDFNLEPLSPEETREYIRHRLSIAGGSPDIFDGEACETVFRYSGGIPRLVNLLCDTALVYGYAEQSLHIGASLIEDVARDKQKSRIVPLRHAAHDTAGDESSESLEQPAGGKDQRSARVSPRRPMRIAIASESERQRHYLKMTLERSGLRVVAAVPIGDGLVEQLNREQVDVLLMDLDEGAERSRDLDRLIEQVRNQCKIPVLFNDSSSAGSGGAISDLGRKLTLKLTSLIGRS
ncbi:general secretion pathway protein [Sulfuricaulis limicola]|uniref:General secretion pathway protein n=1 Tax=Sulfuricaulis limicola TaxID=1620215 RepID=A0A1B4XGK2_9GAMM|nr:AAA family ATPase [Sulfuricaulis limicola]BAV33925.1 general secretion pathway protein [Sulfuricaulis limicola]